MSKYDRNLEAASIVLVALALAIFAIGFALFVHGMMQ